MAAFMAALLADLDPAELFAPPSSPPHPRASAPARHRSSATAGSSSVAGWKTTSRAVSPPATAAPCHETSLRRAKDADKGSSKRPHLSAAPSPAPPRHAPAAAVAAAAITSASPSLDQKQQQQQAFDDLLAGVTFDDFGDDDEWAGSSSNSSVPLPLTAPRAVARPVRPRLPPLRSGLPAFPS
jgi:hypothetical protein